MATVTIVHLLRHGEVYNPDRVLYGRLPGYRLSDLGIAQAEVAAEYLAGLQPRYLVSSPLERAQQTAAPLAQRTGLPVAVDERLIEASNALEGRRVAGGKGLFTDPSNWKYFRNPLRPSWGEPYTEIAARMLAAARSAQAAAEAAAEAAAAAAETGQPVSAVCVSHQLPIVIARRHAEGRRLFHDPRRRQCALASVTSFTFDGDALVGVDYVEPAGTLPSGHGAGA
jgi:broad specificity phosphatase PhoE